MNNKPRQNLDGELRILRMVSSVHHFERCLSLQEIADCVGCSKQSIHAIEARALSKVKTRLLKTINHEREAVE